MTEPNDYELGHPLHYLIERLIQTYEQERDAWLATQGEDDYREFADAAALSVVNASYELSRPKVPLELPLPWEVARKIAVNGALSAYVLEKIQIVVAWEFATSTEEMAKRSLEITTDILATPPSEVVLRFLRRLTRCYVAGFFPECIIICRAVLENAVKQKFMLEDKSLPMPPPNRSAMYAYLQKAEDLGWLTRRARNRAWTVWRRGNKAIHEDPTITDAAFETIDFTLSVMSELLAERGDAA